MRIHLNEGGDGSGNFGHGGRPGLVGGSSSKDILPDGFEREIHATKMDGNWFIRTNEFATGPIVVDGALSKKEALQKGIVEIEKRRPEFEEKLQKDLDWRDEKDETEFAKKLWAYYEKPSKDSLMSLVHYIKATHANYLEAKGMFDIYKVPFDKEGNITLYRGGSPNGLSWTTSKDEAIRFAKYGFGGVDVQNSFLVGIGNIDKKVDPADIHERVFNKKDLLTYLPQEKEVIVDPRVFN